MEIALLIVRLLLALVFAVAGIAKIADFAVTRRALTDFGVPEWLTAPIGRLLPVAEIVIALALLPLASAWWGAVAALILLLLFTVVIGVSLMRGQAPDCRCFGQLHSEPVSKVTILRNLLLTAAAGFVVIRGKEHTGLAALSWLEEWRAAEIANVIFAACCVALLVKAVAFLKLILKQQAALSDKLDAVQAGMEDDLGPLPIVQKPVALNVKAPMVEGLPIGAHAPRFSLPALDGDVVALDDLLSGGRPSLLLFVGPNCWGCKLLLPYLRVWQQDYAERLPITVISHGSRAENLSKLANYELDRVLLDEDTSVADEYQAKWTPAALMINPDGRIACQTVFGDNAIREWLRNQLAEASEQGLTEERNGNSFSDHIPQVSVRYSTRRIGEPPPRFSLPDLTGKMVDASDLSAGPTLLFFWHPSCKFCQAMIDDIRQWEREPPPGAPRLVFIATGEVGEIRAVNQSFKSSTLLDPSFDIGPLFGTKMTPAAILIDGKGRIASSLAIGDQNVRALLGLRKAALQAALV